MTDAAGGGARAQLLAAAREELIEHGSAGIGLRAVARRAGVSHAAPTYFFRDRAGMLTAVATEGYRELGEALRRVSDAAHPDLAALGRAYIDFGLENRALFDLMFRASELRGDDPDLNAARSAAFGMLAGAVDSGAAPTPAVLALWALAHGAVVLARDGALSAAAGQPFEAATELARSLVGPLRPA